MYDAKDICEKITELYPEIGVCGIDIEVTKHKGQNSWVVHLKKDDNQLDHFLEYKEAELCMANKQCVSLGLEIAQLKKNIQGEQF